MDISDDDMLRQVLRNLKLTTEWALQSREHAIATLREFGLMPDEYIQIKLDNDTTTATAIKTRKI